MSVYACNKRALFDYSILDTIEAGLALTGVETKAIRAGSIRLTGAYVVFRGPEAYLINLHVPRYKMAGPSIPHSPDRSRRLLLKKRQIDYLRGKAQEQGLTIIPLSLYTRGPRIKAEIAVVKGKKKYDKREAIKKREIKREMRRQK